jgi:hypothetical protein
MNPTRNIGNFDRKIETPKFVMYVNDTDLTLKCFVGKKSKPSFYFRYKSKDLLDDAILRHSLRLSEAFAKKDEAKAKRKAADESFLAKDHFEIGDIIVNSWGYEQTNIEFYKVISMTAKRIKVQELKKIYTETQFMSGHSIPTEDFKPNGDIYNCTIRSGGYNNSARIVAPKSFYSFSKWDGRPMYESHYH